MAKAFAWSFVVSALGAILLGGLGRIAYMTEKATCTDYVLYGWVLLSSCWLKR